MRSLRTARSVAPDARLWRHHRRRTRKQEARLLTRSLMSTPTLLAATSCASLCGIAFGPALFGTLVRQVGLYGCSARAIVKLTLCYDVVSGPFLPFGIRLTFFGTGGFGIGAKLCIANAIPPLRVLARAASSACIRHQLRRSGHQPAPTAAADLATLRATHRAAISTPIGRPGIFGAAVGQRTIGTLAQRKHRWAFDLSWIDQTKYAKSDLSMIYQTPTSGK